MPLGNIFGVQFIVSQASSNLFDNACLLDENGDAILQEDGTSCIIMENANGASAPPVIEGVPVVLGVPNEGQTLIATSDTITGVPTPTVSWQWERSADGSTGWTSISGATSSSYVVQPSDTGNYLRVVQTATNNQGSDTASSVSSSVPLGLPFNSTSPAVSGTAELGQTLSTTDGTWVGVPTITFTYQWRRDGIDISGANSSTYTLVTADYATDIDCVVTASNSLGSVDAESNTMENIAGIAPVISGVPTISGVIELGEVVTATLASVSGDPTPVNSLQWQVSNDGISGWSDISGETSTTYTIVSSDENKYLRVVQTSTNGQGTDTASSTPTSVVLGLPFNLALPFVSGSAQVDQVLSTTDGTWQGVSTIVFSYQWRRDGIDINGATSSTYTLTASDYTTDIDCVVTATNSLGSVNQDSNDITNIAGTTPVISGVPTISGTAKIDEVLTATSASVSGTPTPTSTLQWEVSNDGVSGWSAISGATSSTYTVLSSDEGKYLRVVQTETNVIGSDTSNSAATAQVSSSVDVDYQAVLSYASDPSRNYNLPSAAQQSLQSALVEDLKSAGVWSKLDVFYVFATDGDSDYATLNWKAPSNFQLTKTNSPTFTQNEGFAQSGTAYLETGFVLDTDGTNFTQDDAGIFVGFPTLSSTAVTNNRPIGVETISNYLNIRIDADGTNSNNRVWVNTSSSYGNLNYYKKDDSIYFANRTSSTAVDYRNTDLANDLTNSSSGSITSSSLPNRQLLLLGYSGGYFEQTANMGVFALGSSLTAAEMADIEEAWYTNYFTQL